MRNAVAMAKKLDYSNSVWRIDLIDSVIFNFDYTRFSIMRVNISVPLNELITRAWSPLVTVTTTETVSMLKRVYKLSYDELLRTRILPPLFRC
jgi:hypothetical protein